MLDSGAGPTEILGEDPGQVVALEPIQAGHKVALGPISNGNDVIKFGVSIGKATRNIRIGEWVHLHNCASHIDERSQTLDLISGAATDTPYE
jgi:hypothetical protein